MESRRKVFGDLSLAGAGRWRCQQLCRRLLEVQTHLRDCGNRDVNRPSFDLGNMVLAYPSKRFERSLRYAGLCPRRLHVTAKCPEQRSRGLRRAGGPGSLGLGFGRLSHTSRSAPEWRHRNDITHMLVSPWRPARPRDRVIHSLSSSSLRFLNSGRRNYLIKGSYSTLAARKRGRLCEETGDLLRANGVRAASKRGDGPNPLISGGRQRVWLRVNGGLRGLTRILSQR
jgi:hypothetical protein